jgi:hypothetical protein
MATCAIPRDRDGAGCRYKLPRGGSLGARIRILTSAPPKTSGPLDCIQGKRDPANPSGAGVSYTKCPASEDAGYKYAKPQRDPSSATADSG